MTDIERKRLFKVNPISLALNIALVLAGMLISLCSLLMIWNDKDLSGISIHFINHVIIYISVIFYISYGYRIKKVNIIKIIAAVFAILTTTASIIFLCNSDLAVPMAIFSIISSIALLYFSIRGDNKIEDYISMGIALLFFIVYAISGCVTLDVNHAEKTYRFFYGLSMFAPFIVTCCICFAHHASKPARFYVMNPPKEIKTEDIEE